MHYTCLYVCRRLSSSFGKNLKTRTRLMSAVMVEALFAMEILKAQYLSHGSFSRAVSNRQNSLREWENKTKKWIILRFLLLSIPPKTPQRRAKLWIWIIRNRPIHRRRNRIYVDVNYPLEYRQISLTFSLYQNRLIPGRVFLKYLYKLYIH